MTPAELEQQPQRERYDQREKREAAERESDFKKAMTVTGPARCSPAVEASEHRAANSRSCESSSRRCERARG